MTKMGPYAVSRVSNLPRTSPCVVVTMLNLDADVMFDFVLYGLSTSDVCVVAAPHPKHWDQWIEDGREGRRELCGSEYVRAALRRRGLNPDDFVSSPFLVRDGTAERGYLRRYE